MDAVLSRLGELGPWGYVLVGVFAFLAASAFVGLVAPGETAVLFAGFLAGQGYLSPVGVVAAASIGGTLGDSVDFYNVSGAVLWTISCTTVGYVAGPNWRAIERWINWIGTAVVIALAAAIVLRWRRLRGAPA